MYNRPLIYYLFFMIIGLVAFLIYPISNILSIVFVFSIVIPFFFTLDYKKFFFVNICFIILGMICINLYFNISPCNGQSFRVMDKKMGVYTASFRGRKIYLCGSTGGLKEGMKICAEGNYIKNIDYEKGIIGKFFVENYNVKEKDMIYKMNIFKSKIYEKYKKILGKDKSSLIMALCCGDSKYLSYNTKKDYARLGIVHILCVSGFHISIVYKMLEKIFKERIGALATFIYVVFTGLKASAIRAYIMIVVCKFSKKLYEKYDALSALALAAIILLFIRPYYILDVGFNLSFLATLGILLYSKKISRYLYKLPEFLNESISISLSAQIFTLPYIAFTMNDVSTSFLLGNIFLIPIYSIAIVLGNLGIIFICFKKLFSGIGYLLYSVLTAIEGGNKILLALSPPIIKFNPCYAVGLLAFYLHFILLKNYVKQKDILEIVNN
ncbi:ComEC/Rec2 family competence protein [Haloimpatiens lingqiaonensis]|uniref:ComEC/Rec2 family competence protein n=1 Tax=Haloimpatiens lingqiaonensis TaxID=1380675 RepID=UPI0010FE9148|nr:ComEC/Rec2 family competence protein [Haloimpatiens lingqiaonensis]